MNKLYVSAKEIAAACRPQVKPRWVRKVGQRQRWRYRAEPTRGRPQITYHVDDVIRSLGARLIEGWPAPESPASEPAPTAAASQPVEQSQEVTTAATAASADAEFSKATEAARDKASQRYQVLKAFEDYAAAHPGINPDDQLFDFCRIWNDTREKHGGIKVSPKTVRRWRSANQEQGMVGLLDGRQHRDKSTRRQLPPELETPFRSYVLSQAKMSIPAARHAAFREITPELRARWEREFPLWFFRRWINDNVSNDEWLFAREGRKAFTDRAARYIRRDYTTIGSNEWWCADHHPCDFWCWNPEKQRAFRPNFTLWFDLRSRRPMSFRLAEDDPDQYAVMTSFRDGVLKFGLPKIAYLDNGRDFRSERFSGGKRQAYQYRLEVDTQEMSGLLANLQVEPHFCLPYSPQSKPVERYFRFFEEWFGKLWPSYWSSQPNSQRKPELAHTLLRESPERLPRIEDMRESMADFFAWYERSWQHSGDGMNGQTPLAVYEANLRSVMIRPNPDALVLLLMPSDMVRVSRAFVRITVGGASVFYKAPELYKLEGKQVCVRYDPDNLSDAYLFNTRGQLQCQLKLDEKVPFGSGTGQVKEAKREQRRRLKELDAAEESRRYLNKHRDVPAIMRQQREEAEAARDESKQLRATGTDGKGEQKPASGGKPNLRVVRDADPIERLSPEGIERRQKLDDIRQYLNMPKKGD